MNEKTLKSLASHVAAHWRNMSEEPKLGKLILAKSNNIYDILPIDQKIENLKTYNCIPNDLTNYRLSVGFLDKGDGSNVFKHAKRFVMMDSMYDSNNKTSKLEDKTAPFTALFFEKWIYVEEIINL